KGHTEDVEHVQEPEESDVCLIPDDEENEVTDAEREKARQVREDADKEDEEQEKEKVQEKEAEAETEDTEEQSAATNESNINENQDQDDGNQQDLSTPTPTFNVEEPDSTERIIISTAVTTEQVCFQCNMTKNCSYRFKPPNLGNTDMSVKRTASTAASAAAAAATKETVSIKSKIVTVPPIPKIVRNVQTMCKPATKSVAIDNTVECLDAQNQTEKDFSAKCLLPVPVPIYLPTPMHMYATPFPVPIPIPIPIPVPIFIPTTRNSAAGIMKEISKIQDKMPADPFEAELLMMAEMVADDKRQEESESDSEDTKPVLPSYSSTVNNSLDTNNFGDDVLQMALKMATSDYDEHPTSSVDLESAMHPRKKRPPISTPITPQQIRTPIRAPAKRMRREPMSPNESEHQPQVLQQQQQQPQQPLEKPDANMCLKYTFGVNAWKQWVVTKNADMEKSSVRRRPFKTELLQMTADELNYSLCLFVKEVRKPNGTEYAPDTIYYLVLGIQQYLYENGRIDNIFTDPYYERFTDCLDEVSKKFSILYNDSQYIVTRVEEEHLWECKQLGAHSPHTVEEHMQLSFSHIMKHWKRTPQNVKSPGARNVLLRFYPPQTGLDSNPRKKKVYEQQENEDNPLRCPVRLYEFYLSKCPESVKTRNDVFYLQPERSCVPDSPVWYSTQALSQESLQKMLHRVKMVKEINIALLTS
uniref:Uncharacterized protein n=1 Tax=Megaselia scalaris TaxID=36166 RepID=T1GGJ3_MEGSC